MSKESRDIKRKQKAEAYIKSLSSARRNPVDTTPKCPKCGSHSVTPVKQGFGLGKAVVGVILVGPVGGLAGAIHSNNIELKCLSCGNTFKVK